MRIAGHNGFKKTRWHLANSVTSCHQAMRVVLIFLIGNSVRSANWSAKRVFSNKFWFKNFLKFFGRTSKFFLPQIRFFLCFKCDLNFLVDQFFFMVCTSAVFELISVILYQNLN
jgi:hypothetical protein